MLANVGQVLTVSKLGFGTSSCARNAKDAKHIKIPIDPDRIISVQ